MIIQMDIIVDDLLPAIKKCFLPIIVVYQKSLDYPDKFAARLWDINRPTAYVVLKNSLEEIRAVIPKAMTLFPPSENDDPIIVETYL